ncbi:hypothetical protein V8C42DRAFT_60404 [Trichoderma barbatum]
MLASATCASPPDDRVIRRSRLVAFSKTALLHSQRRTYSAHLLRFVWAPSCTAPEKLVTRSWPRQSATCAWTVSGGVVFPRAKPPFAG